MCVYIAEVLVLSESKPHWSWLLVLFNNNTEDKKILVLRAKIKHKTLLCAQKWSKAKGKPFFPFPELRKLTRGNANKTECIWPDTYH